MNVWQGDVGPVARPKKGPSAKFGRSDRAPSGAGSGRSTGFSSPRRGFDLHWAHRRCCASPAASQRLSGGDVSFAPLYYFYSC
jgi:hypothetical protein